MITPNPNINKIYFGSCLELLSKLPENCVDLVITSPPYNVGIEYGKHDDNQAWTDYSDFINKVLLGLFRVVRDGGRIAWNVPSFSSRQNLYEMSLALFRSSGFKQYAEIIWNKGQISSRTAWGSFCSPSEPNLLPSHEYILVFYKGQRNHGTGKSDLEKNEFIAWTDAMWTIKPETDSRHPAPFPLTLPRRLIKLLSYPGELIMDPFCGSGTTAIAASGLGRNFVGSELDPVWHEMASRRFENEMAQGKLL